MTRSVWKGPFVEGSLIKRSLISRDQTKKDLFRSSPFDNFYSKKHPSGSSRSSTKKALNNTLPIYLWSRRSTIVPQFVGFFMQIYNGKKWIKLKVTEEMVNHKFGEFALTRTIGKENKIRKTKLKAKT